MKATAACTVSRTQAAAEAGALLEEVVASLRFYAAAGCSGGDCRSENLACINKWNDPACLAADTLVSINRDVAGCLLCDLCQAPVNHVSGVGPAPARLMFVGGWPAVDTDNENTFFTGETGRLLTGMILAMELNPEEVYVTCLVKCRPPGERSPQAVEIEHCRWFLERELALVAPHIICALGEGASRWLLQTRASLESLRGRFHERNGVMVMPTWHPADILSQVERKRPLWEDLKKVMAALKNSPGTY